MTTTTVTPRIYVGTYGKYNAGSLHGAWLNLEDYADAEAFHAACAELHKSEHDPEYMFQDWEGIPAGLISESHLSDDVWEWLALDDSDRELLAVYHEHVDSSATIEHVRDAYSGTYSSPEDYAEETYTECHEIPEYLVGYIDWERVAHDMECNGTAFVRHDGATWVFQPV